MHIYVVGHNDFEDIIVTTICQFTWPNLLELHLSILVLYIDNNKITSHGIDTLVKKKWPALKYLNLSDNLIKIQMNV